MAAAAANGSAAAVNGLRSASSTHAIQSASVPGPREALPRRCSHRDRLRPPLPHHPSSAVSGATHTARKRECAPPCVRGYRRLRPGRGTAKEGTHSCGSGRRKRKEPFCAAPHQSTLTASAPLAAQITCSSMAQGQRRAACLWWRMWATCCNNSQSQKGGEKFRRLRDIT